MIPGGAMEGEEYREEYRKPIIPPRAQCAKTVLLLANMLFFCFGAGLLAIGMYAQLDHGYMSDIIGSMLYLIASFFTIVAGFVIMFVAFFGAWSAYKQRRGYLIVFLIVMIVLALLVLGGGLLSVLFKSTMIQTAKDSMQYSLRRHFGKTRLITDAWTLTQSKLRCCGVNNNGWSVYNNSEWDLMTNADERNKNAKIPEWSPLYKFVPTSCCLQLLDPRTMWPMDSVRNVRQCQYWPYGPPNRVQGGFNDALYYRGCFDAGAEYLSSHSRFFAGLGFFLLILMIVSIICTVIFISNVSAELVKAREMAEKTHLKSDRMLMSNYEY